VGWNSTRLGLAEVDAAPLQPEKEKIILTAIERLARFRETVQIAKEGLTRDLRLPGSQL
jgi:hypothetical protein